MGDLLVKGSAQFSEDGAHRLWLRRVWDESKPQACVLGVNPSSAGADENDTTIRKVIGFGQRLGWGGFWMLNKFSLIATDVRELRDHPAPLHENADEFLKFYGFRRADVLVCAWGPLAKLPKPLRGRWQDVVRLVDHPRRPAMCWGTAKDGQPRHPMVLAYDTALVPWTPPASSAPIATGGAQ